MRPANEISLVSTSIPALDVNALIIGKKLYVASAGASSVLVYRILDIK